MTMNIKKLNPRTSHVKGSKKTVRVFEIGWSKLDFHNSRHWMETGMDNYYYHRQGPQHIDHPSRNHLD